MAVTASAAVSAGLASVRAGELFAVASNVTLTSGSRASYPARMTLSRQARSHWSVLGCGAWACRWHSGDSSSAPFRGRSASALRVRPIACGLTGSHRPLYSAGFATSVVSGEAANAPVAELVDALDSK